jgi:hypothetical protein
VQQGMQQLWVVQEQVENNEEARGPHLSARLWAWCRATITQQEQGEVWMLHTWSSCCHRWVGGEWVA